MHYNNIKIQGKKKTQQPLKAMRKTNVTTVIATVFMLFFSPSIWGELFLWWSYIEIK